MYSLWKPIDQIKLAVPFNFSDNTEVAPATKEWGLELPSPPPYAIIQIYGLKLLWTFKMLTVSKHRFPNPTHLPIGKMDQVCTIVNSHSKIGSL